MFFHQCTINITNMRGLTLRLTLLHASRAYVRIIDADDAEAAPLVCRILGKSFPHEIELRPKLVRGIANLAVYADCKEPLEIGVETMGPFWRGQRTLRRLAAKCSNKLAGWRSNRRSDYAGWYNRFHIWPAVHPGALQHQDKKSPTVPDIEAWILGSNASACAVTARSLGNSSFKLKKISSFDAMEAPAVLAGNKSSWHLLVEAGTQVAPGAINLLVQRLAQEAGPCLVFADIEAPGTSGLIEPLFTTMFDEIRASAHPGSQVHGLVLLNHPSPLLCTSGGLEDLASAALRSSWRVVHIPVIASRLAAMPRTDRTNRFGRSSPAKTDMLVSLIIPSRDNATMLERAVRTLSVTAGSIPVEFIIVDHASSLHETQAMLTHLEQSYRLKTVRAEGEFNFSRLINLGRAAAVGTHLFSVNDDIEAGQEDWLQPLLELLDTPGVGAVGPCLLYPNHTIQHAGVIIGYHGFADHVGRKRHWQDPHLPPLLCQTRCVSAVTGAVLGARAQTWDAVGGWDEQLTVEFNDTDFCFRISDLGLRIVYCAASVLVHHESVSRGDPKTSRQWPRIQRDQLAFATTNSHILRMDIWYPDSLSLLNTRMTLGVPPRQGKLADLPLSICDMAPPPLHNHSVVPSHVVSRHARG